MIEKDGDFPVNYRAASIAIARTIGGTVCGRSSQLARLCVQRRAHLSSSTFTQEKAIDVSYASTQHVRWQCRSPWTRVASKLHADHAHCLLARRT